MCQEVSGKFPEIFRDISRKSAEAPSEANASGRVEQRQIHKSNQILIQVLWGRDLCLPLTPSTAPAQRVVGSSAVLGGPPDPYKTNEKSTFSPSGPPRDHHAGQERPKSVPRPSQEVPRRSQEAPRGPKTAPRQSREAPRQLKEAPRPPQEAPR